MLNHSIGYQPSSGSESDAVFGKVVAVDAAVRGPHLELVRGAETLWQSAQIARELAEIERAAAALRRAEPALEIWTAASTDPLVGTPHSVWRSIGLVWFATVTIGGGALAVIAHLAGQAAHRFIGG
jgi:hypothetical protein